MGSTQKTRQQNRRLFSQVKKKLNDFKTGDGNSKNETQQELSETMGTIPPNDPERDISIDSFS